ncbi:TPA: AbrB/MazE/SpoVT family DNA-binding domain-containing protein [Neisseria meningitidis]
MLRVQKWGNSAAVRLPADMLKQLDFKIGDTLVAEVHNGELRVRAARRFRLADLLAEMEETPPRVEGWEILDDAGNEVV